MIFLKKMTIKSLTKKLKNLKQNRIHNQPSAEAIQKEIKLYRSLAKIYAACNHSTKFPFGELMVRECLRAAADLDCAEAQYQFAQKLIEEGVYRNKIEEEGLFANTSNQKQSKYLFDEALAYLIAAEKLENSAAKRLHGLCYINGWGVEINKKKGFDLVVASIDQENSWDRVPQIFAEIGLNKPEFFSALGKHRGGA